MTAVRLVQSKGRSRVRAVADGKNVQCPNDWRETLVPGRVVEVSARLRADGECWVYYPPREVRP